MSAGQRADVAPDLVEPIDGWRVWSVVVSPEGHRLASVFAPVVWPVGEPLAASCLKPRSLLARVRRAEPHGAPEDRCECGIYATALSRIAEYLLALAGRPGIGRVLGRVSLWGDVVECEHGFRGSYAYPRQIFVPADAAGHDVWPLARALADYGVPVELLAGRCGEAPRELEHRLAA